LTVAKIRPEFHHLLSAPGVGKVRRWPFCLRPATSVAFQGLATTRR